MNVLRSGPSPFRVAILTGLDSPSTRAAITRLLSVPGVTVVGVLADRGLFSLKIRLRRLWKRVRREGPAYLALRVAEAMGAAARRLSPHPFDAEAVRRAIFPDEIRSLPTLCERHRIPYAVVDSLNSHEAQVQLKQLDADLAIVIGTRILKRETFALPRLGSINVHKGKVPEYRGQPPAFWELYHREKEAGVTIHVVESKLDAGDVVREDTVPIGVAETEHSLKLKLDDLATDLLAEAVESIAAGRATPRRQLPSTSVPNTIPTQAERKALERRLGTRTEGSLKRALRGAFYRICFAGGLVSARDAWLRLRRRTRLTVLLYHRVNDTSRDKLTTSVNRFIEHLATLKRHYRVISLAEARAGLEEGRYLGPNAVVITFDDGYADNHEIAAPILEHFELPATFFVSAGLVDTTRPFAHDMGSPYPFRNLTWDQVRNLAARGFEIGSHGLTHANLALASLEDARREIVESRELLERMTGARVQSFAYPFGGCEDITPAVVREVRAAGYELLQSAYGGVNSGRLDPWNVRRVGISDPFDTWALRAEVSGISLRAMRQWWTGSRTTVRGVAGLGAERLRP